ncbi:hypothetical protein LTR64_004339 [Lithohypha guttulata]|uniref:uncharacterized protein n=1 Tax=Lithohypha guttulata TaxID=1690604 RepID=UPI00315D8C1D
MAGNLSMILPEPQRVPGSLGDLIFGRNAFWFSSSSLTSLRQPPQVHQLMKFMIAYTVALLSYSSLSSALRHEKRQNSNATNASPKIIIDNDWGAPDFYLILMALALDYEVLGLTSNSANTWALQSSLHALRGLELGNLTSCIPVYKGADYPLLNTPSLFQSWQYIHGALPWQGVFAPENLTAQAAGFDPTSGDPNTINPVAFVGGTVPDQSLLAGYQAAIFMIESVRKYPSQVSIYSAGALTNIALAIRLDPTFAQNAKELVVMGGYIDTTLLQATGDFLQADINSDINLKIDPESSKIALTADWRNVTLVSAAANNVFINATDYAEISSVNNTYTQAFVSKYFPVLPAWDATAMAVLLDRENVLTNSTEFFVDVDVAWFSPYYGEIRAYQQILAPMGQQLRNVSYAFSVDEDRVKSMMKQAMMQPRTCADV